MIKVKPRVRGFICTTAHPEGCKANVIRQINYIKQKQQKQQKLQAHNNFKRVLIIGASTGYGLASRIAAAFGLGAETIGVFFEREASGNRTASAGWYNSAAFEQEAQAAGLYAKSINGDAFSPELKQQVINLIKQDWEGQVDLIIYSLAAPRRENFTTGEIYQSVLKPIGQPYQDKTVNLLTGEVFNTKIEPAKAEEIVHTEKVMGGEDWQDWITACKSANILSPNFKTIAYSYIGPELTYPIYRSGTIGRAKEHLEKTARNLQNAIVCINKCIITQASAAIPVVPLYSALLYKAMKDSNLHEDCIGQMWRLFANLVSPELDKEHRIRLDDHELRPEIQQKIKAAWDKVNTENLPTLGDLAGCQRDFYQLFGFEVPKINYEQEVDIAVQIPSINLTLAQENTT